MVAEPRHIEGRQKGERATPVERQQHSNIESEDPSPRCSGMLSASEALGIPGGGAAPDGPAAQSDEDRLQQCIQTLSYALRGLSHDLHEPIRTIRCYSELLNRNSYVHSDPNLAEFMHFILGATQRLETRVNRMLGYARLLGQDAPPFAEVDLNVVAQTALANLQMKIEESGATIVTDALPRVLGDQDQLSELFENIIANSMKYRGTAAPQISVRAEGSGEQWIFSIEDNGVGIDPKYSESIFAPFKRLHQGNIPGTGLGLAICRQIVEHHRGRIWVESIPGKGSTFRFTLPRHHTLEESGRAGTAQQTR